MCDRGARVRPGTVGRVLCLHDDGDVEVLFPAAGAAGEASEGVFTFAADRLEKDKASPSLEVGDWVSIDRWSRTRSRGDIWLRGRNITIDL